MFEDDINDYLSDYQDDRHIGRYGIYDLSDCLSDEDLEEMRKYEPPVSLSTYGLSERDFF
jgi:hypothetical protein